MLDKPTGWTSYSALSSSPALIAFHDRFLDEKSDEQSIFLAVTAVCAIVRPEDEVADVGNSLQGTVIFMEQDGTTMIPWHISIHLSEGVGYQFQCLDSNRPLMLYADSSEPFHPLVSELLARSYWMPLNWKLTGE